MKELIEWATILLFAAVGLALIANTTLISWFPAVVHTILGGVFIATAVYMLYKKIK